MNALQLFELLRKQYNTDNDKFKIITNSENWYISTLTIQSTQSPHKLVVINIYKMSDWVQVWFKSKKSWKDCAILADCKIDSFDLSLIEQCLGG